MIVYDESEHYNSPFEEDTLRILLNFLPREEYDKLLYRSDSYVRSYYRSGAYRLEKRSKLVRIRNCRIRIIEAEAPKETVEAVYPLASGG